MENLLGGGRERGRGSTAVTHPSHLLWGSLADVVKGVLRVSARARAIMCDFQEVQKQTKA